MENVVYRYSELSTRAKNLLKNAGIKNLTALRGAIKADDLRHRIGAGVHTLEELEQFAEHADKFETPIAGHCEIVADVHGGGAAVMKRYEKLDYRDAIRVLDNYVARRK